MDRKSSSSSRNRASAHGRENSNRCVTSWIAIHVRKSVGASDQSRSNAAMFATTKSSELAPPGRGTATSYCPRTCCPSDPSTEPTCAPSRSGEICWSSCEAMSGVPSAAASGRALEIASASAAAAGSRSERKLSMFLWIHCARRTASTFGRSFGASSPGPRWPWRCRPAAPAPSSPVRLRTTARVGSPGTAARPPICPRAVHRRDRCHEVHPWNDRRAADRLRHDQHLLEGGPGRAGPGGQRSLPWLG